MRRKRLQSPGQSLGALLALVTIATARLVPETAPPRPDTRWKHELQGERRGICTRTLLQDDSWTAIADCNRVTMRMMDNQVFDELAGVYKFWPLPAGKGALECSRACLLDTDCRSFNYQKLTRECFLLITDRVDMSPRHRTGWSCGYKSDCPEFARPAAPLQTGACTRYRIVAYFNTQFYDTPNDVFIRKLKFKAGESVKECMTACSAEPDCLSFQFEKLKLWCYLLRSGQNENKMKASRQWVVGVKSGCARAASSPSPSPSASPLSSPKHDDKDTGAQQAPAADPITVNVVDPTPSFLETTPSIDSTVIDAPQPSRWPSPSPSPTPVEETPPEDAGAERYTVTAFTATAEPGGSVRLAFQQLQSARLRETYLGVCVAPEGACDMPKEALLGLTTELPRDPTDLKAQLTATISGYRPGVVMVCYIQTWVEGQMLACSDASSEVTTQRA